jgi:HTH-type transcriptional regulator/antitoxin HigA
MNIKPIKTEKDYQNALKCVADLMDAALGSPEGDKLEILSILIEKYEEKNFPIQAT